MRGGGTGVTGFADMVDEGKGKRVVEILNEMLASDPLLDFDAAMAVLQDSLPAKNIRSDVLEEIRDEVGRRGIDRRQVDAWNREIHRRRNPSKQKKGTASRTARIEKARARTRKKANVFVTKLTRYVNAYCRDSVTDVLRFVLNGTSGREWREKRGLMRMRVEFGSNRNKLFRKEVRRMVAEAYSDLVRGGAPW